MVIEASEKAAGRVRGVAAAGGAAGQQLGWREEAAAAEEFNEVGASSGMCYKVVSSGGSSAETGGSSVLLDPKLLASKYAPIQVSTSFARALLPPPRIGCGLQAAGCGSCYWLLAYHVIIWSFV